MGLRHVLGFSGPLGYVAERHLFVFHVCLGVYSGSGLHVAGFRGSRGQFLPSFWSVFRIALGLHLELSVCRWGFGVV